LARENCGADSWAVRPSGTRGVLNDAISIYFADATLASAFVARWCAGWPKSKLRRRARKSGPALPEWPDSARRVRHNASSASPRADRPTNLPLQAGRHRCRPRQPAAPVPAPNQNHRISSRHVHAPAIIYGAQPKKIAAEIVRQLGPAHLN
jgi:hypothetical protein